MASIRVRAIAGADTTEVQALVQHPMDSGFVKDSKGQLIPPHHIETVQFETGGKVVFTALWGPAVSKDPFVKFSFKGGRRATISRSPGSTTRVRRTPRRPRLLDR